MKRNSGNKAAKHGTDSGSGAKNRRNIEKLFESIKPKDGNKGELDEKYRIGKVIKDVGEKMRVFYVDKKVTETITSDGEVHKEVSYIRVETVARICGSFRGSGKKHVPIRENSIVLLEISLGIIEIIGVLTRSQLRDLSKETEIHHSILNENTNDEGNDSDGIEFCDEDEKPLNLAEI